MKHEIVAPYQNGMVSELNHRRAGACEITVKIYSLATVKVWRECEIKLGVGLAWFTLESFHKSSSSSNGMEGKNTTKNIFL